MGKEINHLIICGSYRSGTSILVKILNEIKRVFITDESLYYLDSNDSNNKFLEKIDRYVNNKLLIEERPIVVNNEIIDKQKLQEIKSKKDFCNFINTKDLKYFGDKLPEYVFELNKIKQNYNFKVIMCIRDARDVIASQLFQYKRLTEKYGTVGQHWWAKKTIEECLTIKPSWYDFISAWDKIKNNFDYYELYYSSIVNDMGMESIRLSNFLGLCSVSLYKAFAHLFDVSNHRKWTKICPSINKLLPDNWKDLMIKYGFDL